MQEKTVEIRGQTLRALEAGDGPTVLYLHGFGGLAWSPLLERLSARHRVLAPEHPGFGRGKVPDWMTSAGDLAYFYLDLLAALDLEKVHLVGHAVGGWIAAELAIRNCRSGCTASTCRRWSCGARTTDSSRSPVIGRIWMPFPAPGCSR